MAMRTPRTFSRRRTETARLKSPISTPSVISSSSRAGERPVSSSTWCTSFGRSPCWNCTGDRLMGEELELFFGLHALRHHRQSEPAAERDHRAHDGGRLLAAAEIGDEGLVDLDLVERKRLQIRQRRIAGAEIVHGDAHAESFQPAQDRNRAVEIADQHAFGDLELESGRRCLLYTSPS